MNTERALDLMARPGSWRWALVVIVGVWLWGFDSIADRLGFPRGECVAVERLRAGE